YLLSPESGGTKSRSSPPRVKRHSVGCAIAKLSAAHLMAISSSSPAEERKSLALSIKRRKGAKLVTIACGELGCLRRDNNISKASLSQVGSAARIRLWSFECMLSRKSRLECNASNAAETVWRGVCAACIQASCSTPCRKWKIASAGCASTEGLIRKVPCRWICKGCSCADTWSEKLRNNIL